MPSLLLALAALSLPPRQEPTSAPPAPHTIVLVTVDTLRREHLGCYGYFRPTSPRVDALAAEALLFEQAYAPMATTFPSHLSMLTGLYPHQHGYTSNPAAVRRPFRSAPGCASAAEALRTAGFRTAAFVSSVVLHERTGIASGFERFSGPDLKRGKLTARETTDQALAWLAGQPAEEPLFLWVHLWDAHEPNEPPPETAALFRADDQLRSWVRGRGIDPAALAQRFQADAGACERFFGWKPPAAEPELPPGKGRTVAPDRGRKRRAKVRPDVVIDEGVVLGLFDRYDACVRAVDGEIGRLVDALKTSGRWERAAFVFTADHGQSLGEGQFLGHGLNTNLNTRVPLVVHLPSGTPGQPARRSELVSLVDLMPTLLARIDQPALASLRAQFEGHDILDPTRTRDQVLTAESTEFHGADARPLEVALVTPRWKLVRRADTEALFDLSGAGEGVDVRAEHADVAAELARELEATLARTPARVLAAPAENDAETQALLDELEALGYGGGDD